MKNLKKMLMCLSLVCCLSLGVACGSSDTDSTDDSSQDTSSADVADNATDDETSDNIEVTDEDGNVITTTTAEGESADGAETTTQPLVTDADGNIVTDSNGYAYVTEAVTESDGSVVTDDSGNVVTQRVTVTTAANGNSNNSNNNNNSANANANADTTTVAGANGNNATTTVAGGNATTDSNSAQTNAVLTVTEDNAGNASSTTTTADSSVYFAKNRYSSFFWMSVDAMNIYESGAFAEVTFKVLDTAKAGTYPIEIVYTDLSNENADLISIPAINGTITVGDVSSKAEAQGAATEFAVRVDNGYAKVGETVTIKLYIDNNPGISIFEMDMKYDNNALEVESILPTGIIANDTIDSNLNHNNIDY
jgi:hypothetical protein